MTDVKFRLPKFWTMSKPVLEKVESELENLSSAGSYRFQSRLRYWGLSLKTLKYARFHLYNSKNKKIKTVSGNFLDYKFVSLGSSAQLSFLIELPRNVEY